MAPRLLPLDPESGTDWRMLTFVFVIEFTFYTTAVAVSLYYSNLRTLKDLLDHLLIYLGISAQLLMFYFGLALL